MNNQMYYLIHVHYWGATVYVSSDVETLNANYDLEISDRKGLFDVIHTKDYDDPQKACDAQNAWHQKMEAKGYIDADPLLC